MTDNDADQLMNSRRIFPRSLPQVQFDELIDDVIMHLNSLAQVCCYLRYDTLSTNQNTDEHYIPDLTRDTVLHILGDNSQAKFLICVCVQRPKMTPTFCKRQADVKRSSYSKVSNLTHILYSKAYATVYQWNGARDSLQDQSSWLPHPCRRCKFG